MSASHDTCNHPVFSWVSPYLTFPVQARHNSYCYETLILLLFQHDILTSINSTLVTLTNLRSHLAFLHLCWTRHQASPNSLNDK